jgi:hypothetical protein
MRRDDLVSGNFTVCHGKSHFILGESSITGPCFIMLHPLSTAMLHVKWENRSYHLIYSKEKLFH